MIFTVGNSRTPLPMGRNIRATITNKGPGILYLDSDPSVSETSNDATLLVGAAVEWLPYASCYAFSSSTSVVQLSQNVRLNN